MGSSDQIALPEAHFFDKMYQFLKAHIVFASPRKRRVKYRKSDISKPFPISGEPKLSPILEDQLNSSCEEAIEYQEKTVRIQEPVKEINKESKKSPKEINKSTVRIHHDKSKKAITSNNRMVLAVIPEKDETACENWTKAEVLSPRECQLLAADLRTLLKLREQMEKYLYTVNKVKPPENELQKVGERVMSEHELRVQRSLQRLNLPDWYRNTSVPQQGFLLGKRGSDAAAHWPGLGSKTTSLSSLGSNHSATPRSPTTGQLVSPSPTGFTRWSTSRLNSSPNSASTSPSGSARSSFNYRQPYLGWRSQERIARPRTPAERLAQGLLPLKQQHQNVPNLSEVHTSIKEVTSAIASYVSKGDDRLSPAMHRHEHGSSRSASPRGSKTQLCWLESSFVGSKPLEVPETPMSAAPPPGPVRDLHLDLTAPHRPPVLNGTGWLGLDDRDAGGSVEWKAASPGSTTMEDVLDSLLGLPTTANSRSPSPNRLNNQLDLNHLQGRRTLVS